MQYTTNLYYAILVNKVETGFYMEMNKKKFNNPVIHTPEEYNFPDKLYEAQWEVACAWGVLTDGALIGVIETCPKIWSNRLRMTELWVLETQSGNVNTIDLYQHEGFTLIGMDTCCYTNNDLERKEVRLELGWFL